MCLSVKSLAAAALAFGGVMAFQPEPVSAQPFVYRTGIPAGLQRPIAVRPGIGFRPAVSRGFNGPRWGGPGWRARGWASPRWGWGGPRWGWRGGYRPAYWGGPRWGWRGSYWGGPRWGYGYPYRYYGSGWGGGAVAAGLIGGLALGAIASAATNPYYYPSAYYGPSFYTPAQTCFIERRRIVNRYGRVVVRRVQTCY